MEKIKIQIKSWKTKNVLFEHEVEGNTIKITLEEAVSKGVDLSGADLNGADLKYADLNGVSFKGADLKYADLKYADLKYADLNGADLTCADLRYAKLRGTDLRYTKLFGAVLNDADLRNADLSNADLTRAVLSDADLKYAVLSDADLSNADLSYANLRNADLNGVNMITTILYCAILIDAKNVPYIPMACPSEGSFIGWKKIREYYNHVYLVKLEIPADARRSSATTDKCRCDKAKVLEITSLSDGEKFSSVFNPRNNGCLYKVGEMVYPDAFDEDRWNECSNGIHFFINKESAIRY